MTLQEKLTQCDNTGAPFIADDIFDKNRIICNNVRHFYIDPYEKGEIYRVICCTDNYIYASVGVGVDLLLNIDTETLAQDFIYERLNVKIERILRQFNTPYLIS